MKHTLSTVALLLLIASVGLSARAQDPNSLTDEEKQAGWRLLFDGQTTKGWRGYKSTTMPASWRVENGSLLSRRTQGESFGDIITVDQFDDFELVWEWKMTEGNNSGVIYRASEEKANVWETGPEYQILDNQGHLDGLNPLSSRGPVTPRSRPPRTSPARWASGISLASSPVATTSSIG